MKAAYLICALLTASAAFAHQGVKHPDVKTRMHMMGTAQQATKTLGDMAKAKLPFNAQEAAGAKATLIDVATLIPQHFQNNAIDPVSEARPEIWQSYSDFTAKAEVMFQAADALNVDSLNDIRAGLPALGRSCNACHKAYRQQK